MIKLEIKGNKQQTITNVCNECGAHIKNLGLSDIVINNKKNTITPKNDDGSEITQTELPKDLKVSKCVNCA
tara:strand:+ start:99 stop:311 length:213 start_codon:yes stop_codon:yes gene_type:complete